MISLSTSLNWGARLRLALGGFLVLAAAGCGSGETGLSTEAAVPADSAAQTPTDTAATPGDSVTTSDSTVPPVPDSLTGGPAAPVLTGSALAGIAFATFNMQPSYLSSVHTGSMLGGPLSPSNIVSVLTQTRSKGGRLVVKLCKGKDSYVKNADGTFSLSKWKALVGQYKTVNLGPFINDGTLLGHFLIDEPHRAARWGGKIIPQSTIEAMAAYSKQIWPAMPALVRVVPSWLASAPVTYRHLDAGWLQYASGKGDVTKLVTAEVSAAKAKGLGLLVGMNVMDGGNGSSKIPGVTKGKYAMSATELRTYGTALLNQSYACAFYNWQHNLDYYGRIDIKAAMADLSAKARLHAKTSCRQ